MFFLVSGAAASGKSTVAKLLSSRIDHLICHDHDEKKMDNEHTRCHILEDWIQVALTHQQDGKDFLLTSHSPLGELLACPSAPKLNGIFASLLNCQDPIRIQRMRDRGFDPRWPPSQHVLNWASWHRMHAWDPQWEQDVIVGNGSHEHDYNRWTNWGQSDPRWQVTHLDTSDLDVDMMLDLVEKWIISTSERIPSISRDSHWWE